MQAPPICSTQTSLGSHDDYATLCSGHVTNDMLATPTLSEGVSSDGLAAEVAGHRGLSLWLERHIQPLALAVKHSSEGEGLNQSHDYHIALWGGGEGLNQSHDYHTALWGGGRG